MGFTGDISREAAALGYALLAGLALGAYYDLFRILRRVFHFGYAMILAQDIFFWLTGAVGIFFGSFVVYGGQLRILFVMAALAGWGIYAATIGSLVMAVVDRVLLVLRRIFAFFTRHVIVPLASRSKHTALCIVRQIKSLLVKTSRKSSKKGKKMHQISNLPLEKF